MAKNRKKKRKGGKQRSRKMAGPKMSSPAGQLSPCVLDYAVAVTDPFDGPLSCLPAEFPPLPSYKTRVWAKGSGATGTINGFVMMSPSRMAVNDANAVCYSNNVATYIQDGFPATTGDAGTALGNSNSLYGSGQLGAGAAFVQYRVVGAGLRAWYTGAEVDLSGNIICLREPNNTSLVSTTSTLALAYQNCRRVINTSERNVVTVLYMPVGPNDISFGSSAAATDYCLGIIFQSKAAVASAFAWEAFAIVEYIGRNVPGRTRSHADPEGFSAVLSSLQNQGDTYVGRISDGATKLIKAAYHEISAMSGPMLRTGARAALAGGVNYFFGGGGAVASRLIGDGEPGRDGGSHVTIEDVDDTPHAANAPDPVPRPIPSPQLIHYRPVGNGPSANPFKRDEQDATAAASRTGAEPTSSLGQQQAQEAIAAARHMTQKEAQAFADAVLRSARGAGTGTWL